MRGLCLAFILLLLNSISAIAANAVSLAQVSDSDNNGLTVSFKLPSPQEIEEDPSAMIAGLSFSDEDLGVPIYARWVAVPDGYKIEAQILERTSYSFEANMALNRAEQSEMSAEAVESLELRYPEAVTTGRNFNFRGVQIAPLTIFPYQMSSDGNSGIENRNLKIRINFVPDLNAVGGRIIRNAISGETATYLEKLLINPPHRDYDEPQYNHIARMLILRDQGQNDDTVAEYINKFADWKRKMGYSVDIVGIDLDRMGPIQIRQLIRNDYYFVDDPISHVVIVGTDSANSAVFFPSEATLGDHYFSLMDDESEYSPDISIGRLHAGSIDEFGGVINRTLRYEQDPFLDDGGEWIRRAVLTAEDIGAQGGQWALSMIQLGRWMYTRYNHYGYTVVDTFWAQRNNNGNVERDTRAVLAAGRSLAFTRGWLMGCWDINTEVEDAAVRTGRKHPFIAAITCYSENRQEPFFRTVGNADNPNGPIAALAMFGQSHTKPNNAFLGWLTRGIVYNNMHQPGWLQLLSKQNTFLDLQFSPDIEVNLRPSIQAYRLMGDPSVNVLTHIPEPIVAEYPAEITPGFTGLNIEVSIDDNNLEAINVCLMQDDGIHLVTNPGDDGWARFTFDPNELDEGNLYLTISRYNAIPVIDTIQVAPANRMLDLTDVSYVNQDGLFGNGETIATTITLRNTGEQDVQNIVVNLSTEDPWVTLSENNLQVGNITHGNSADVDFDLVINRASRAGRTVRVSAVVTSGGDQWEHAFDFTTSGHLMDIRQVLLVNNDSFDRGTNARIKPELRNRGDLSAPAMTAELVALSANVDIIVAETPYQSIASNTYSQPSGGQSFTVQLDQDAIPGDYARFRIDLRAQNAQDAFRDTLYLDMMIGEPTVSDPFGPDGYGYICFDSGDEGWAKTPVYEWIEINPNQHQGNDEPEGERLPMEDYIEEQDTVLVVDLPFQFRFYGEDFNEIVVCTNGWIAFGGEQALHAQFRNWPIPGIQGPDAQVAALLQDLIITRPYDQRGVYTYYDEITGTYIVEWSQMQIRYADENVQDTLLVDFEVLLYDPARYPTSTGDGEIKVQYKTFIAAEGESSDNHYSTIGIKNLDNTDGLQYAYWNRYSDRCMPLRDETALLYTVDVRERYGALSGTVVDAANADQVLEGVIVRTDRGLVDTTNAEGRYNFDPISAGIDSVTFFKFGYNRMRFPAVISEDETTNLNVELTHPELVMESDSVYGEAREGYGADAYLRIGNEGNGPLEYDISLRYLDGSQTRLEEIWKAGVAPLTGDIYQTWGCQFVRDSIYIAGNVTRADVGDEYIYVINPAGELVRSFPQPCRSAQGFKDMAYDGTYLYGGEYVSGQGERGVVIIKFDYSGEEVDRIVLSFGLEIEYYPNALAWRSDNGNLLVAKDASDIFEVNMEGELVNRYEITLPGTQLSIKGLAWNPADADQMPLYIMDKQTVQKMRWVKADLNTGRAVLVKDLAADQFETGQSFTIGYDWVAGTTTIASIADNFSNDTLRVFEIGPDARFIRLPQWSGVAPAGGIGNVHVRFESLDFVNESRHEVGLWFEHNAAADPFLVRAVFKVENNTDINGDFNPVTPVEFGLEQAYPNPFNAVTRIGFSLQQAGQAVLAVYDIHGRQVAELANGQFAAGNHNISFDAGKLASGIYFYRLESAGNTAIKRMVLMK